MHSIFILLLVSWTYPLIARDIFLNGTDISNATNQNLKKVDILIDSHGSIFITAPHYEVHEEDTFLPLSSKHRSRPAMHKQAGPRVSEMHKELAKPPMMGATQKKELIQEPAAQDLPKPETVVQDVSTE